MHEDREEEKKEHLKLHPLMDPKLEQLREELDAEDEAEEDSFRKRREAREQRRAASAAAAQPREKSRTGHTWTKQKKIAAGTGAAVVLLAAGVLFVRGGFGGGTFLPFGDGNKATESQYTATPGRATASESQRLSPEEQAKKEHEEAVAAELSSYQNLGIVDVSGYINLRNAPDSIDMTNIIGKLSGGAACEILKQEGDWAYIRSGGIEGYVYAQYLKTGEEAKQLAEASIGERAVIETDVLNIRTAPELDAQNVVGKARKGERYELIEQDGDWAKVKVEVTDPSIKEAYINIGDGNAKIRLCLDAARKMDLREMALTQYDTLVVANTSGYINVRKTPEDKGIDNICGQFPAKAGAELLETVESGGRTWYKIKSGAVTGYVSAEYCATGQAAKQMAVEDAVLTAYVRTDALNVRSEPSTDAKAWTQVTKDQAYHVLNQLDGWVEIELDSSDDGEESDKAYVSTRDNNVEVKYGLTEAVEYYPAVEAANAAMAFRNQIVNYACQFVGNPYVWGGTSLTNGADCSGFTMKVLEHFGISIPRVSRDQARAGQKVTAEQMKPGDLVFYANRRGVINHVGMYIGNGQVVNAASRRSGIRIYRWNYRTPVAIRNVIGA